MRKIVKVILVGAGAVVGLLVLLVVVAALFFDLNDYKPRIAAAVEKNTGMQLKINGDAALKLFPVGIALNDVQLANRGSELLTAKRIEVAPRILPFLTRKETIITSIWVIQPVVSVEKGRDGRMNYEPTVSSGKQAAGKKPTDTGPGRIDSVKIVDGTLRFVDRAAGGQAEIIELQDADVQLAEIAWSALGAEMLKSTTFKGDFRAGSLRSGQFGQFERIHATNLAATIRGERGLIRLDSTEAALYGGTVKGSGQADLRGATPKLSLTQNATAIDLSQLMPAGKLSFTGAATGALQLEMSGADAQSIARTAQGTVSLAAENIQLVGIDLDRVASTLRSAKGPLELAQLATSLVAGSVTAASGQAAGVAGEKPAETTLVKKLVSNWRISDGIAVAQDVALATPKTVLAFQGKVNLVSEKYQGFSVATVDSKGCAKNKIALEGSLKSPKPTVASLGEQAARSFIEEKAPPEVAGMIFGAPPAELPQGAPSPGAPASCEPFYSGAALRA